MKRCRIDTGVEMKSVEMHGVKLNGVELNSVEMHEHLQSYRELLMGKSRIIPCLT